MMPGLANFEGNPTSRRRPDEASAALGSAIERVLDRVIEQPDGALIGAVLSSANRDPRRWTEPDRFDIHRKEGAHLAFALGNHFCLGAWFGRHLARVSLEVLLDRLPGLHLDPDRPVECRG